MAAKSVRRRTGTKSLGLRFRSEELEKEVAILKEKNHHLDDMLKSQQRKVRHMIEQVRPGRPVPVPALPILKAVITVIVSHTMGLR